jgi:ATP synthase protein I
MKSGSFLESILAGALLGYLLDWWLGTEPWLVIIGIVLGSYSGFMRIWAMLKEQDGDIGER